MRQQWIIEILLGLGSAFFIGLLFIPIVGLICGPLVGLLYGLWVGVDDLISEVGYVGVPARSKPNQGIWQSFQSALAVGSIIGLIQCAPLALFLGIIGVFSGMLAHWWLFERFNSLTDSSLVLWILDQGTVFMHTGLFWGLGVSIIYGLCIGIIDYGGRTCIQHVMLRLILYRSGALPWNLTRFLDYCADRIFLRKVGGGYIFVHRMLMEYFASLERGIAE